MNDPRDEGILAAQPEASQHYRVDASAMSYRELWSASKLLFPVNVAMKLLGVQASTPALSPLSTSLQRLDWGVLSDRGRDQLGKCVAELKSIGFDEVLLYCEDWRGRNLDCFSVALLDEARTTLVLAMYTHFRVEFAERYAEHIDAVFYSFADDGGVLVSRSSKFPFSQPPEYETVHLPALPMQDVADLHQTRMSERTNLSRTETPRLGWRSIRTRSRRVPWPCPAETRSSKSSGESTFP